MKKRLVKPVEIMKGLLSIVCVVISISIEIRCQAAPHSEAIDNSNKDILSGTQLSKNGKEDSRLESFVRESMYDKLPLIT